MNARRIGWIGPILIAAMVVYALWNITAVRLDLIRAEEYRRTLMDQTQALTEEIEGLEREIALAEDGAVMERIARNRLGLVYPGEVIFCSID